MAENINLHPSSVIEPPIHLNDGGTIMDVKTKLCDVFADKLRFITQDEITEYSEVVFGVAPKGKTIAFNSVHMEPIQASEDEETTRLINADQPVPCNWYLNNLDIVVDKDSHVDLEGLDFSDMTSYTILHEITETWLLILSVIDVRNFGAFKELYIRHTNSLMSEFVRAQERGELDRVQEFHEAVDRVAKVKIMCPDLYGQVRQWLDSDASNGWPPKHFPELPKRFED